MHVACHFDEDIKRESLEDEVRKQKICVLYIWLRNYANKKEVTKKPELS